MTFAARQQICLRQTDFEWRASTGPFGSVSIVDALRADRKVSEIRVLRWLRVAGAPPDNHSVLKGQVLRYLAELAWAPDAMLQNRSVEWSTEGNALKAAIICGGKRYAIEITLDDEGRIGSVFARHLGRWLPFKAEVEWVLHGQSVTVWRGQIKSWQMTRAEFGAVIDMRSFPAPLPALHC